MPLAGCTFDATVALGGMGGGARELGDANVGEKWQRRASRNTRSHEVRRERER